MNLLEKLFAEIDTHHTPESITSEPDFDRLEKLNNCQFPIDLKEFYRKYKSVRLFDSEGVYIYRFVPIAEIHPTRIDIFGQDTDEWAPRSLLTICDVMDGNYIAIDTVPKNDDEYYFIDCFHETFGVSDQNKIIAKSFTELLEKALHGGDELYYLQKDFIGYGFV
jgi:hypothetical protein